MMLSRVNECSWFSSVADSDLSKASDFEDKAYEISPSLLWLYMYENM